jgi:hypothetical protein
MEISLPGCIRAADRGPGRRNWDYHAGGKQAAPLAESSPPSSPRTIHQAAPSAPTLAGGSPSPSAPLKPRGYEPLLRARADGRIELSPIAQGEIYSARFYNGRENTR